MNAQTVMNNTDLLNEIFPFAFATKSSCCDKCKVTGTQLHLHKTPTAEIIWTHPSIPPRIPSPHTLTSLYEELGDSLEQIQVTSVKGVTNNWFCDGCWISMLYRWEECDILSTRIKEANPTFDKKQIQREIRLITSNEFLFKTHRLKKTQEKAKLYEDFAYEQMRYWFAQIRKEQERSAQQNRNAISQFIQKVKQNTCSSNSRHWVKEIVHRKIAKFFAERKISHKFHLYIASQMYNHCTCPTWSEFAYRYTSYADNQNRFADQYAEKGEIIKSKQTRFPPVPEWWYEL